MSVNAYSPDPTPASDERLDEINEHLRLLQKKNGLTYGTDAYLLAAFIRPSPRTRAIELGSGTGVISLLLLAKRKVQSVTAVEIQPSFADLIGRNAAINGMEDRLFPLCRDLRELSPRDTDGEAGLVFANPPYMGVTSGKRNESEEKYIARHEICGSVFDFCAAAGRLLKHGGRFAVVWRPDRLADLFRALNDARLEPKRMVTVYADTVHEPSCVLVEAIKGAAPGMRPAPPLILYEEQTDPAAPRILTAAAQKIYETCSLSD